MDKTIHLDKINQHIIDISASAEKLGIDYHEAYTLLATFIATLPEEAKLLHVAYGSGSLSVFIDTIHRFNGALHYVGLPALQTAVLTTEIVARQSQNLADLDALYQNVIYQIHCVETEYTNTHTQP